MKVIVGKTSTHSGKSKSIEREARHNTMVRKAEEAPNKQRFLKAERKTEKAEGQRGCN